MFSLVAFLESVDAANAYNALAAIADQHIRVSGDDLYVPKLNQIIVLAAGVGSGGLGHVRLAAPSLRGLTRPILEPVNGRNDGNVEPDSPHKVHDYRRVPIPLLENEVLNAEVHSDTTAAAVQWLLAWLADGPVEPVAGKSFTVRATGTTTLVANAWTNVPLVFDEDLPRGRYQVIGMRARSTGCIAGRLVFIGGIHRPGVLGTDAQEDLEWPGFRQGGLGVFGEFDDLNPPSVDFLSLSADTAETVILDLVQVAAGG